MLPDPHRPHAGTRVRHPAWRLARAGCTPTPSYGRIATMPSVLHRAITHRLNEDGSHRPADVCRDIHDGGHHAGPRPVTTATHSATAGMLRTGNRIAHHSRCPVALVTARSARRSIHHRVTIVVVVLTV